MMRLTVVTLGALLCLSARAAAAVNLDKASDEAIMAAAEQLVSEGKSLKTEEVTSEPAEEKAANAAAAAAASAPTGPSPTEALANADAAAAKPAAPAPEAQKESEIPIFAKSDKVVKSESNLIWRLVASMGVLLMVAGGLIYTSRRYSRGKNKGGEKVRIEVLHQYHMGPRKSLALVRVAGEAVLIGCTDQSINMIKSVTLIDDELEGILGKDFNEFLEDDFKIEDMRSAIQSRGMGRE
jgi:flagellar protein FliO/FliZ